MSAAPATDEQPFKLTVITTAEAALALEAALTALEDPMPLAVSRFEDGPVNWRVEAYFEDAAAKTTFEPLLAGVSLLSPPTFERVPPTNWVRHVEAMLSPVTAGKFLIYGPHDRDKAAGHPHAIEIEAGEAFGTAHHGSTEGCLFALSHVVPGLAPKDVLDLGTGTGVLAIAVAKLLPEARILATDIDPRSVEIAAENAVKNGVGGAIAALVATGLDHARLSAAAQFDLIVANILAGPLIELAPGRGARAAPAGPDHPLGPARQASRRSVACLSKRRCRRDQPRHPRRMGDAGAGIAINGDSLLISSPLLQLGRPIVEIDKLSPFNAPPSAPRETHAMLQSFDDLSNPSLGPARLALLREAMAERNLDGYIVPRADEHQGEYVPASAERLRWLTGFTGSAGTCVVLTKRAALFVDGRYTMQAAEQADGASFDIVQVPNTKLPAWLADTAGKGASIGYDPRLFTPNWVESTEAALSPSGVVLTAIADNLVDGVWSDRPGPPLGQVTLHRLEFAGIAAAQKIAELQTTLAKAGDDAVVLTMPDSIAWLFNIRGADLRYTPFALSYAVVPARGRPAWFIDPRKLDDDVRDKIATFADVLPAAAMTDRLTALGIATAKVRLDPNTASKWFADTLAAAGATVRRNPDPCQLAKAKKNATELDGARAAHKRDAVAVCRLLAWLNREAMSGALDEIAVATKLEGFRHDTGALKDLSFDTISAAGPHAALPHYRVNKRSNLPLAPNSVFLIDSGGQYEDGTTDITRTVAIGDAGLEARERFTLVLKGMIAVSLARFPAGTRGCDLDPYARRALWAAGLDFDHGTGHGIGSYLSVHEGPQGISKGAMAVLEPGMIISNEPGYYKAGHYGIRIENLVVVTEATQISGGERPMHSFETISFAPIDRNMIEVGMLTGAEREWLDAYHGKVREVVGPNLRDIADRSWLEKATARLG